MREAELAVTAIAAFAILHDDFSDGSSEDSSIDSDGDEDDEDMLFAASVIAMSEVNSIRKPNLSYLIMFTLIFQSWSMMNCLD